MNMLCQDEGYYKNFLNTVIAAGGQPEVFQGREGFVEFGHFNKHSSKTQEKKAP